MLGFYKPLDIGRSDVLGRSKLQMSSNHNDANKTGREYKDQTFLGLLDSSEETVLHDELVNFEVTGFEWLCQKRLEVKQEVLCEARPVTYR